MAQFINNLAEQIDCNEIWKEIINIAFDNETGKRESRYNDIHVVMTLNYILWNSICFLHIYLWFIQHSCIMNITFNQFIRIKFITFSHFIIGTIIPTIIYAILCRLYFYLYFMIFQQNNNKLCLAYFVA